MHTLNYDQLVEYYYELHYALEREITPVPSKLKKLQKACKKLEDQCHKGDIALPPKIQYKKAM